MSLVALVLAASAALSPAELAASLRSDPLGGLAGLEAEQARLPPARRDACALAGAAEAAAAQMAVIERRGWLVLMTDQARAANGGQGRYRLGAGDLVVLRNIEAETRRKAAAYRAQCRR